MSSEQLLNIMLEIQKKVEETASITTEEVVQDLVGKLKEVKSM